MDLKSLSSCLVVIILISFALYYSYQIYKKKIKPMLSTWLILFLGVFLSFITYIVAENKDIQSGILNTAALIEIFIIIISIIIWGNASRVYFKSFEKKYLFYSGVMVLFWIISKNAFVSNLLAQILLVIGYFPTIQNLIVEKRKTESLSSWNILLLAAIIALYPAINKGNNLAIIFAIRTILMVAIIIVLIISRGFKNTKFNYKQKYDYKGNSK